MDVLFASLPPLFPPLPFFSGVFCGGALSVETVRFRKRNFSPQTSEPDRFKMCIFFSSSLFSSPLFFLLEVEIHLSEAVGGTRGRFSKEKFVVRLLPHVFFPPP